VLPSKTTEARVNIVITMGGKRERDTFSLNLELYGSQIFVLYLVLQKEYFEQYSRVFYLFTAFQAFKQAKFFPYFRFKKLCGRNCN
jgi:hypothetical protein